MTSEAFSKFLDAVGTDHEVAMPDGKRVLLTRDPVNGHPICAVQNSKTDYSVFQFNGRTWVCMNLDCGR